jgi:shikimate kinase
LLLFFYLKNSNKGFIKSYKNGGEKMANEKTIVLIGFMGVGKTTIGKELAAQLQSDFVDADEAIEEQFDMQTSRIFDIYGEKKFREKEMETITELIRQGKKVVSLGGGAFLQEETRERCMTETIVIHLEMSWESWQNRIPAIIDSRPVLHGKKLDEIKKIYDERKPIYASHHIKINVDNLTPKQAAEAIIKRLSVDSVDHF